MTVLGSPSAMRLGIRPYGRLLVAGFHQQSTYLAAAAGGLLANATFGFLKAAILTATVAAAGGSLQGYDTGQMLAFVWLGQGMLGLVNVYGKDVLGQRITSGEITIDFLRPVDLQAAGLATFLGTRLFTLLPRGIPSVLIGAVVTGMAMPARAWPYPSQPAAVWPRSLLLVFGLAFPVVFTGYLPALWLLDLPGPSWAPPWLAWLALLAALWAWVVALGCWRWGMSHYQGAGG